jgi:hypothetical protein
MKRVPSLFRSITRLDDLGNAKTTVYFELTIILIAL